MLMPVTLQVETASIYWSVSSERQLNIGDLYTVLGSAQTYRQIILISGCHQDGRVAFDSLVTKRLIEPNGNSQVKVNRLFQLEPVHKGFCPPERDSECPLVLCKDKASMKITTHTACLGSVELLLDETSGSGRFTARDDSALDQGFCVDAVEVLSVEKIRKPILF